MNEPAPIAVSVYSRLDAFRECISALAANGLAADSDLYVVSDAPGREKDEIVVEKVRKYARSITGFKHVHLIFRDRNLGGMESIAQAEALILEKHGRIIFLEDDVIPSRAFLQFLNEGLEHFRDEQRVYSISAYCPPVACSERWNGRILSAAFPCPWGYATWHDRRRAIDPRHNPYPMVTRDRKLVRFLTARAPHLLEALRADFRNPKLGYIDVRIGFQVAMRGMHTVQPALSLTRNIGCDGGGERMPHIRSLNSQPVCHDYEVIDWNIVADEAFQDKLFNNGISDSRVNPLICLLYRLGLRDHAEPLLANLRFLRRFVAGGG